MIQKRPTSTLGKGLLLSLLLNGVALTLFIGCSVAVMLTRLTDGTADNAGDIAQWLLLALCLPLLINVGGFIVAAVKRESQMFLGLLIGGVISGGIMIGAFLLLQVLMQVR
ncbi:MAG: hypothetical protein K1X39_01385 [Thermoflexales bacterium]|nr:hypothetical protein [Thermoflexales bacterium]